MRLDLFSKYNSAYDIGNVNQFVLTLVGIGILKSHQ